MQSLLARMSIFINEFGPTLLGPSQFLYIQALFSDVISVLILNTIPTIPAPTLDQNDVNSLNRFENLNLRAKNWLLIHVLICTTSTSSLEPA